MSQALGSALTSSRRSSFVKHYLLVLWPNSTMILMELARRLGDEIGLPGESTSLLANCLAEGAANFYRLKKERYNSSTWDLNLFLQFYHAVFSRATAIFNCRVCTHDGACWDVTKQPYLDWRLENPGPIEVSWQAQVSPGNQAEHLFNLVLSGSQYPRNWSVEQLKQLIGKNGNQKP